MLVEKYIVIVFIILFEVADLLSRYCEKAKIFIESCGGPTIGNPWG